MIIFRYKWRTRCVFRTERLWLSDGCDADMTRQECIQQISLYRPGCEALKANPDVVSALNTLVDKAWSEEAKDCAKGALMQLTDHQSATAATDVDALHIMMSCACDHSLNRVSSALCVCIGCGFLTRACSVYALRSALCCVPRTSVPLDQWDVQPTIKRIVAELQQRDYLVWFDRECYYYLASSRFFPHTWRCGSDSDRAALRCVHAVERMKGSVMDAMVWFSIPQLVKFVALDLWIHFLTGCVRRACVCGCQ
jgi:hypothetical protein